MSGDQELAERVVALGVGRQEGDFFVMPNYPDTEGPRPLVERLRIGQNAGSRICEEAADEIERLRAALTEIAEASGDDDDPKSQHYSWIQATAKEALRDE